jgi:hypothetical protein
MKSSYIVKSSLLLPKSAHNLGARVFYIFFVILIFQVTTVPPRLLMRTLPLTIPIPLDSSCCQLRAHASHATLSARMRSSFRSLRNWHLCPSGLVVSKWIHTGNDQPQIADSVRVGTTRYEGHNKQQAKQFAVARFTSTNHPL